jgi:hypothetical protein
LDVLNKNPNLASVDGPDSGCVLVTLIYAIAQSRNIKSRKPSRHLIALENLHHELSLHVRDDDVENIANLQSCNNHWLWAGKLSFEPQLVT